MNKRGGMVWDKGRNIESKCGSLGLIRLSSSAMERGWKRGEIFEMKDDGKNAEGWRM